MTSSFVAAFLLGVVAQASLVLSGLAATWFTVPNRIVGWIAAFGAGALISAVAFDLVEQGRGLGSAGVTLWMLIGAGVFIGGDYAVDRQIGPSGAEGVRSASFLARLSTECQNH